MNQLATWTYEENRVFELALSTVPEGIAGRWQKLAEAVPGRTVAEVIAHYHALENDVNAIDLGWVSLNYPDNYDRKESVVSWNSGLGTSQPGKGSKHGERERKKGNPWTKEEHRKFLEGLKIYGKGDWRSISRNSVVTKTPTQVASHAQKYFIRLESPRKNKKRSSIHDITTTDTTMVVPPPLPPTQTPQPPTQIPQAPMRPPTPKLMPPQQLLAHDDFYGFQGGMLPQMDYDYLQDFDYFY